ncbi:MAG: cytochrome c [Acidobacteriota bacterium]
MAAVMRCSGEPRQAAVETPAVRGEAFFLTHCASCHGPHGRGTALAASTRPPDFQSPAWQSSRTDEQILQTIVRGKPGTAMLGWPMLSNQERVDLVAFIRSLGSGSDATRTNGGG